MTNVTESNFFIIVLSLLSKAEVDRFFGHCHGYVVNIAPIKIDGHMCRMVTPKDDDNGDFGLMEKYCQCNMRQAGAIVCPLCRDEGETVCGHLMFERYIS